MKGVQFLIDDEGERKAVMIDLGIHSELWEDFFDAVVAKERQDEPRGRHWRKSGARFSETDAWSTKLRSSDLHAEIWKACLGKRRCGFCRAFEDWRPIRVHPDAADCGARMRCGEFGLGTYRIVYEVSDADRAVSRSLWSGTGASPIVD